MKHGLAPPPCPPWLIILSGFICSFLGTSITYLSGIIHIELLAEYGQSDTKTAWSGSICNSVFALAGKSVIKYILFA